VNDLPRAGGSSRGQPRGVSDLLCFLMVFPLEWVRRRVGCLRVQNHKFAVCRCCELSQATFGFRSLRFWVRESASTCSGVGPRSFEADVPVRAIYTNDAHTDRIASSPLEFQHLIAGSLVTRSIRLIMAFARIFTSTPILRLRSFPAKQGNPSLQGRAHPAQSRRRFHHLVAPLLRACDCGHSKRTCVPTLLS
jgi:hypothetical protein